MANKEKKNSMREREKRMQRKGQGKLWRTEGRDREPTDEVCEAQGR